MTISGITRPFLGLFIGLCVLAMAPAWETRDHPWDPFPSSIGRIVAQNDGTEATLAKLEPQLLALLQDHQTPEEKGIIYASIAQMYAQKGDTPPSDVRTQKAVEYSILALKEPLDVLNVCRMYSIWGGKACSFRLPPERFGVARRKAVLLALLGLRTALDNGAPAERQPSPGVFRYDYHGPPNSPELKALDEEYRRAWEAHDRVVRANELAFYRQDLVPFCVALYCQAPYDIVELKGFCEVLLVGYQDVAKQITDAVEAKIKEQEAKATEKAEKPAPAAAPPKAEEAAPEPKKAGGG